MSQESIKKIHDWLETISSNVEDSKTRLQRIENAVLGDEHGDFKGHKHRLESVERNLSEIVRDGQEQSKRIDRVYWTGGIILIIISIIAAIL